MKRNFVKLEVCVDSVDGALAAQNGGADRLELCAALSEGGITPSIGLVRQVLRATKLPVMVMIRPRGGGFVYSPSELDVMMLDIDAVNLAGAHGVVFGALTPQNSIDQDACRQLLARARKIDEASVRRGNDPLSVTFHRAFDVLSEPLDGLDQLIALGFDHLLTSGQGTTAEEGCELIAELVSLANDRIKVMPGGGVTAENAASIITATEASEIHGSASTWQTDTESEPHVLPAPRRVTCEQTVREFRRALELPVRA